MIPVLCMALADINPQSIVDEVIWVVGDEPILKSDVESMVLQAEQEGVTYEDPYSEIPEQIAVQKLFLNQAVLDSIEVSESEISSGVDQQVNYWISLIGSREKLEEYRGQSLTQIKQSMHDDFRDRQMIERERDQLVKDIKVSPADVRKYFSSLPEDSIPYVPTTVEVQIITITPKVAPEEIARVKDELRNYSERVTKGETSFSTLARLYSEDPGTARMGGELDYTGRGMLDPAFAAVAFNLTDPRKVSKIVESEFGYHIIQLIDKRGDKIKCRHILLKPKVSADAIDKATEHLDSLRKDLVAGKFTFDEAASYVSDDKDTKSNMGIMANFTQGMRTSRFQMNQLPSEVARAVSGLQVGEVSEPFKMVTERGKTVCAIVKLRSRTDGHRATITEDFEVMKEKVLERRKDEFIKDWVQEKIRKTYVWINDRYKASGYKYDGWLR